MSQFALHLLNDIFVQYPGDFLYFLLLIPLSLAALLMSLSLWRASETPSLRRYPLAFSGVLGLWMLLILGAAYSNLTGQASNQILPPLEHAISVASLLLITWLLLGAGHERWLKESTLILLGLLAVVTLAYTFTGVNWIDLASTNDFNLTVYGVTWAFLPLAIAVVGIAISLLLFREIADAPLKMVYFAIMGAASAITVFQMSQARLIGNYAGLLRLSHVLGLVLLLVILYRLLQMRHAYALSQAQGNSLSPLAADTAPSRPIRIEKPVEVQRLSPLEAQSVQLLKALGMILEGATPEKVPQQILLTVLEQLHGDVGAIFRLQDANYADIVLAYDKVMERPISSIALNLDDQPTLVNSVERNRQNALYPDRNKEELADLYTRLDIEQQGAVYFQPLVHQQEVIAVLMLAYPYTQRELRPEELELLKGLAIISSNLLALSFTAQENAIRAEERMIQTMVEGLAPSKVQESMTLKARQDMQEGLQQAREQIAQLSQQVTQLKLQLDDERTRLASVLSNSPEHLSISQRIAAITTEQENFREERERLAKRLQETEAALTGATASGNNSTFQNLIDSLRREKDHLQAEKQRLQQQLDEIRAQDKSLVPSEVQRLLNRMIEEKTRLEKESKALNEKLKLVSSQLQGLGIEDDISGLAQLISQLYDERTGLQKQNTMLQQERDMLLKERQRFAESLSNERFRDERFEILQSQVENLAADREAISKQRDKLRSEREELIQKLNAVKENRARLLAKVSGYELELAEAREELLNLMKTVQTNADAQSQIVHERDTLAALTQTLVTERDQLLAQLMGDVSRFQQVNQEGVGSLKGMIESLSEERDKLQRDLNLLRTQFADLEQKLQAAEVTSANNNGSTLTYHPQQPELLVGLVQELRTPMTSIAGYIDLLLGESAGILGEMQRKFLQRVASNISRLDTMIDSLINVTELDTGQYELRPHPINMVSLVEDAITNATIQFREKGLLVGLDIDDGLPPIPVDKDSMVQVIGQLLTNAYLISPPDSEIHITVSQRPVRLYEGELPRPCLYMAIQDRGGGIAPEDIARVFARKYKAENPLIEGLGDTGVGMSIAKALVEAHQGRLWVETQAGQGSIFAFAIPLDIELQAKGQ